MSTNGIYIVYDFENYKNKIYGQLTAMSNYGFNTYLLKISSEGICTFSYFCDEREEIIETLKIDNYSMHSTKSKKILGDHLETLLEKYNFKLIYIRRLGMNISGWSLILKKIKKDNSRIIYYEIPTFPFDKVNSYKGTIVQYLEKTYFKFFVYRYVDWIPVVIQNDCKLDKKMIEFNNAINPKFINESYRYPEKVNGSFKIIAIAHVNYWHGYDRALRSIAAYKGDLTISLCIISNETKELRNLKQLSKKLGIEKNIEFKSYEEIKDIKSVANKFHIALGSLGYWRRNGKYDTSIKNKEYCALGIPFILANVDKSFSKSFAYQYKVQSDDSIFDMEEVIEWYRKIAETDYKKNMIDYATKYLGYELQMKEVLRDLYAIKNGPVKRD